MVQGFEIDQEKVSASRYVGAITVRFIEQLRSGTVPWQNPGSRRRT